jgi:hypothetical protein
MRYFKAVKRRELIAQRACVNAACKKRMVRLSSFVRQSQRHPRHAGLINIYLIYF